MSNPTRILILLLALLMATVPVMTACSSDDEDTNGSLLTSTATPIPTITEGETTEKDLWTGNPVVDTLYGTVRGFEDKANTWVWKAISYARPPIEDLRWKAPLDPEPWDGIREKTDFCSACSQYDAVVSGVLYGSEDCL